MRFSEAINNRVLIADGAIGTMLYSKGVGFDANLEHLNLVRPAVVAELHREYLAAGARLIETNTFGANRTKLAPIGLERKVAEINMKGVQIARRAAAESGLADLFISGSVGPLARLKGEERELSATEMTAIFREQTLALADGGADLLLFETFPDIEQLLTAVAAAKETGLPVIASMAFLEGERSAGGCTPAEAARRLTLAGVDLIGANCAAGPREIILALQQMSAASELPMAAFANSGFPEYIDGRYIYRTTPEYFAEKGVEMAAAGASVIGGCCGTTPAHIRQLAARLAGVRPGARVFQSAAPTMTDRPAPAAAPSGFLAPWGERPVVTVELDPPKGLDCTKVITGARLLKEAGADAINLAENPLARVRMGNMALAHRVIQEAGIDVIVHVTCRDRNLLGLQSDLMGACLLGIRSILAVTGDPARLGDQTGSSSVFDLNSFGLIKLLADMNSGVNAIGQSIGTGTGFTIGCALNPNSPKPEVQGERFDKKIASGAMFAQTQPVYDIARALWTAAESARTGVPVLLGIMPLIGARNCEYLHNEVPGIVIPEEIRKRMQGKEKEAGALEGLKIAKELIDGVKDKVKGFYIIAPFGRCEVAAELVQYIRGQSR